MLSTEYTTCDLYDAYEQHLSVCPIPFFSYGMRHRAEGQAVLVRCYADNSLLKRLLAQPGNGKILIVDGGNSLNHALMGDQVATEASNNGWAGVIIFGAVRDIGVLSSVDLHIKALGNVPRKTHKHDQGIEITSMECGGIGWHTDDWVYSDPEGLVISPERLVIESPH